MTTESTGAVQQPPSLGTFLDAGCDLAETGVWLDGLARLVLIELPLMPPRARVDQAERSRCIAKSMLASGDPDIGLWWGRMLLEYWGAEVYVDPSLAEKLRAALPAEVATAYEALVDLHRRPYPLEVRKPYGWWSCSNCGATFDEDEAEAVVIQGREDHFDLPEDITYCLDCVERLAAVALAARRPQ